MLNRQSLPPLVLLVSVTALMAGCTVHPKGEQAERRAAALAGERFEKAAVPLPEDPSADDLVQYALIGNGDLERQYWAWRSAIEQIPQDGTQATNLALSANVGIVRGATGLADTALAAGNDPMADLVLPPKISVAARRALENARAAGIRFRKGQFQLRAKVLSAWSDYVLNTEMIRLGRTRIDLLKTTTAVAEARNQAGAGGQQDLLKARNEVDLAENDLAALQAQLPTQRALLNALLNRDANAPLPEAPATPPSPALTLRDDELLSLAAKRNPELEAIVHEIAGRTDSIALARLQYLPDFSVNAGSDLSGIGQSVLGMITVPILRHEAIDAAIAQAEANLRGTQAMHRQARGDVAAQVISNITMVRDAGRQLELFQKTILPRLEQFVAVSRTAYETGRSTLPDLLESQRSLIGVQELIAKLYSARAKALAELEAIVAQELGDAAKSLRAPPARRQVSSGNPPARLP